MEITESFARKERTGLRILLAFLVVASMALTGISRAYATGIDEPEVDSESAVNTDEQFVAAEEESGIETLSNGSDAEYVCLVGNVAYVDFDEALQAVANNQIITLLTNINYDGCLVISGKTFTLELAGFSLNVVNTNGIAVIASNASRVMLTDAVGGGQFNATSTYVDPITGEGEFGILATRGSQITVTNATGVWAGVYALDENTIVTVTGNATGGNIGVAAYSEASVLVVCNVYGGSTGIVTGSGSVTVYGSVFGDSHCGINAYGTARVSVAGNLTCDYLSMMLRGDAQVIVEGLVTIGAFGVFMVLEDTELSQQDGIESTSKPGFLVYTNGDSTAWIKILTNSELDQAKISKASAINSVLVGLVQENYTPESWAALLAAISNALAAVEAATTIEEVQAVTVPHALSILVVRAVVGPPGSGDLNGDGFVTLDEALRIARVVVGSETFNAGQFAAADMDQDGYITMTDVLLAMRKALGI